MDRHAALLRPSRSHFPTHCQLGRVGKRGVGRGGCDVGEEALPAAAAAAAADDAAKPAPHRQRESLIASHSTISGGQRHHAPPSLHHIHRFHTHTHTRRHTAGWGGLNTTRFLFRDFCVWSLLAWLLHSSSSRFFWIADETHKNFTRKNFKKPHI
jgi:hypothetical protein